MDETSRTKANNPYGCTQGLTVHTHTQNRCQTTAWQGTFDGVGVLYTQQHACFIFASLCCSFCCWKAEVDIPALSVESLLHLDLGSQGCPGPAGYHLNHTLISPPCTLCCWINNAISVKQLLLPSCSHLLSPSGFLSLSPIFANRKVHATHTCFPHLWGLHVDLHSFLGGLP